MWHAIYSFFLHHRDGFARKRPKTTVLSFRFCLKTRTASSQLVDLVAQFAWILLLHLEQLREKIMSAGFREQREEERRHVPQQMCLMVNLSPTMVMSTKLLPVSPRITFDVDQSIHILFGELNALHTQRSDPRDSRDFWCHIQWAIPEVTPTFWYGYTIENSIAPLHYSQTYVVVHQQYYFVDNMDANHKCSEDTEENIVPSRPN